MNPIAIITGAGAGLGRQLANCLDKLGWHLMMLDIDEEALKKAQSELGHHHQIFPVDLLNPAAIENFTTECLKQQLNIKLLINNAGITHRSPASTTDTKVFQRIMQLNWQAPVSLTQALLPLLKQSQGSIICIGSMAGWMPVPGRAAYCASKAALLQHFETWRPELNKAGIDLLMVYPSFLDTNIEKNALGASGDNAQHARSTVGQIQSAKAMAQSIIAAYNAGKKELLSQQPSSRAGRILWTLFPNLYRKISWKKFSQEL